MNPHQLLALFALASTPWATTVDWQQVGGSFVSGPTGKGIVGQGYLTPAAVGNGTLVQSGFLANPLFVQNAPFVASPLPDLRKGPGFQVAIHLDSVFADLDGSALTYSVHAIGTGLQAVVSGTGLNLQGVSSASSLASVVVTASDGVDSVSDTFQVTTEGSTALAPRAHQTISHQLAASVRRTIATAADLGGPGRLGPDRGSEAGLSVDLLLPGPGTVSVRIFDNLGVPVIAFEQEVTESDLWRLPKSGDGRRVLSVGWNLRASSGEAVPSGVYLWKLEVATTDGRKIETIKRLGVKAGN